MALSDWPTTSEVASITTTDAEADSIKSARADINQTIVNVNGLINSFGPLGNIANGQILKYDSTQDKFLPANESGGTGTPAGSDTEIQYNDSGSFGADQYFTLKSPGGGTSCTLNHRGHFNTGLNAGGQITSSGSTFQISHDSDDRFKILVQTSGPDGYNSTNNPGIKWGGDGAYGIYPQNVGFDSDQSHVIIAQGSTDGELRVKFRSNGSATANIIMEDLPTADPNVAGQLWSNSGVLTVSSG